MGAPAFSRAGPAQVQCEEREEKAHTGPRCRGGDGCGAVGFRPGPRVEPVPR
eukprot:CAMPEP_0179269078 /NCGR_PEP_ID=MMETSP0797-20121207/30773_1 /TAXON_ID=47934 /ORGANISM="Dinophysis acuminata, Strain DAEP01" /LENGTH=51 /DNA_ID=CAMNT_0020977385 /DNA_START=134 /DNA_END=286 /DNA_ORIENTATION=+